jgi:hypothetical protein
VHERCEEESLEWDVTVPCTHPPCQVSCTRVPGGCARATAPLQETLLFLTAFAPRGPLTLVRLDLLDLLVERFGRPIPGALKNYLECVPLGCCLERAQARSQAPLPNAFPPPPPPRR